ncbi:MAG: pyridoxamine 5'-phosphate oxidase family protein [Armatimonadota bacterium]
MRREDRRIDESEVIEEILRRATVLHLAMVDGDRPYVLPLSYGYDGGAIYLHSASEGRKIEVLRAAPRVCFTVSIDTVLNRGERPCDWSFRYRSVVGEGTVAFVDDGAEKRRGLDALMRQHGGRGGDYPPGTLDRTTVLRIDISALSGKQAGYE